MTTNEESVATDHITARGWAATLAIEVAIALVLAVMLVAVAWGSSNAIRFVYGGY
jgi:hypothetical protein